MTVFVLLELLVCSLLVMMGSYYLQIYSVKYHFLSDKNFISEPIQRDRLLFSMTEVGMLKILKPELKYTG